MTTPCQPNGNLTKECIRWPKIDADDVLKAFGCKERLRPIEVSPQQLDVEPGCMSPLSCFFDGHIRDIHRRKLMSMAGKKNGMAPPATGQIEGFSGYEAVKMF